MVYRPSCSSCSSCSSDPAKVMFSEILHQQEGPDVIRALARMTGAVPKLLEAVWPPSHPIFQFGPESELGSQPDSD